MAENKQPHTWIFDLRENTLTKDVKDDYTATVRTLHSMSVEDIARAIVAERTEYRLDTIMNIANLIDEKIRDFICQGNTVVTGTALYSPTISGVFSANGTFDPAKHALGVNISPAKDLRSKLETVTPEFSGYVKDLGGARIGQVKDTITGKTDGTLSPGGIVEVTGKKIKSLNADGTAPGKVVLVNTETQAETDITSLAINDPGRLMFAIPATLPEGTYQLRVETYYSASNKMLTAVRTIDYGLPLHVGTASTGGQTGTGGEDTGSDGSCG